MSEHIRTLFISVEQTMQNYYLGNSNVYINMGTMNYHYQLESTKDDFGRV